MFEVIIASIVVVILTTVILLMFFKKKVVWWEILVLLAISILLSLLFRWIVVSNISKDVEFWGTRFERVEYHERWNEYIHQTCTRTCCCDSKGNNCSTETYDCSYVRNHPKAWYKIDHVGNRYSISSGEYNRLKSKMNNNKFKDMHRDYHSVDGDMYYTIWDGKEESYECIVSKHTYENKTQIVKNVYNYPEVDTNDIKRYELFTYPLINTTTNYQKNILGYNDRRAEHSLQILNGELGHTKQVKVFILIFKNQPMTAANLQQYLWDGGNKNEFVIPINIDADGKPTWCIPFSWSEKELPKVNIRDFVLKQETLDLNSIVKYAYKEIGKNYERKEFSDFDYLEVELSGNQLFWNIAIIIIINILLSAYIIHNEFEEDGNRYSRYRNRFR